LSLPNVSLTKVTHLACAGAPKPPLVVWNKGVPPLMASAVESGISVKVVIVQLVLVVEVDAFESACKLH
jgi:hypothetical protein